MKTVNKLLLSTAFFYQITQADLPLFEQYPSLKSKLPHVSLGNYPTPIISAKNLAKDLGIKELYVKDDGVVGGNKNRKLEFLFGDAVANGFKSVCTVGSAGSNHACETARCAQMLGLKSILVLNDQYPTSHTARNLKLDIIFGANVNYFKTDEDDILMQYAQELCKKNNYYYVPMGGSNELGAVGFINAMFELRNQINQKIIKEPDVLYVTLGSSGMAAGIIIGAKCKIIPVRISYTPEFKTNLVLNLIKQTEKVLHDLDSKFNYIEIPKDVKTIAQQMEYLQKEYNAFITHDMAGEDYALTTKSAAEAIDIFEKELHFKLEGTYTGKAASALVRDARNGLHKNNVVLFWNSFNYGSFENLTSQVSLEKITITLPIELHHYFTDQLQAFDKGV